MASLSGDEEGHKPRGGERTRDNTGCVLLTDISELVVASTWSPDHEIVTAIAVTT
jgi:hypothetical protein